MTARRRSVGLARRECGTMTGPVAGGADEFEARLASFVKDNRLYGAAAGVVHAGELAWAGGAGFADITAKRQSQRDTLYRIASITKTFTGTAIMQLRDAGKLDLDDPAVDWLPELKAGGSPKTIARVTIRRLLSHESGLIGDPPGADWTLPVPVYEGLAERSLARAAEIVTAVPPRQGGAGIGAARARARRPLRDWLRRPRVQRRAHCRGGSTADLGRGWP